MTTRVERSVTSLVNRFLRRPPTQGRSRALVEAVLTAFEDTLSRVDGAGADVTVDAVLERAGVSPSSFHTYFGDKPSLLGAFVGHLTDRNFRQLVEKMNAMDHRTVQGVIQHVVTMIVATYCERPAVTRAAVTIIGRFGLMRDVVAERDRFSDELAGVLQPFYPDVPRADLARSMRALADAAMGVLVSELERGPLPDRARLERDLTSLAVAFTLERHGLPLDLRAPTGAGRNDGEPS